GCAPANGDTRRAADGHAVEAVRDGVKAGGVGPGVVALDAVAGARSGDEHATEAVPRDHVAGGRIRPANERVRRAVHLDTVEGVPERDRTGRIEPDEVALDRGVLREDEDPVATVAGDDVPRGRSRPADDVVCPAIDRDAAI